LTERLNPANTSTRAVTNLVLLHTSVYHCSLYLRNVNFTMCVQTSTHPQCCNSMTTSWNMFSYMLQLC